jgi:hypothetical protein
MKKVSRKVLLAMPWAIRFEYIGYAQVVIATHAMALATCPLMLIESNFSLY